MSEITENITEDTGANKGPKIKYAGHNYNAPDAVSSYLNGISRYPILKNKEEIGLKRTMEIGEIAGIILDEKTTDEPVTMRDINSAIKNKGSFYTELWESHKADLSKDLKGKKIKDLPALINAGKQARDKMILGSLRFVIKATKKYFVMTESMAANDIIQEGNIGLIDGIERYDYMKGFSLLTYCSHWITQRVERSIENKDKMIRVPVHAATDIYRIRKFKKEYNKKYGIEPDDDTTMTELGIPRDKYILLEKNISPVTSLNLKISNGEDEDFELQDYLSSDVDTPETQYMQNALTEEVMHILSTNEYDDRERYVLIKRLGLDGGEAETLACIGSHLGITRERVRQIEAKVIKKVRFAIRRNHGDAFYQNMQTRATGI